MLFNLSPKPIQEPRKTTKYMNRGYMLKVLLLHVVLCRTEPDRTRVEPHRTPIPERAFMVMMVMDPHVPETLKELLYNLFVH